AFYVQTRGVVRHERFSRLLTDHSNFFGPLNCLFYAFSAVRTTPYVDVAAFPELKPIQDNWHTIRDEALGLDNQHAIRASEDLDDIGFNSFFKTGWKRFYLKWYGANLRSAEDMCPRTVAMLDAIPSVKGAMFAMLPPGARLVRHRDPYAGSLRYHLGLVTPNSDACFIEVDGQRYAWRDGEAVMFDETYLHFAENQSGVNRIVLFLDVKRPVTARFVDWINTGFSRLVMSATTTKNLPGDKVGGLNRAFGTIYKFRLFGKRVKAYSTTLYYGSQVLIYGAIIYLLVS
ncbi:MAG: aspartyl/asparaginyl beta-hydroxylase domain-containing protein, partial [Pseudomonadales bacterium]|nr:aspartyl/asparaginyl beta-hydroxylase domain-containing protein [Pseudomonadales bacterium]